MGREFVTIVLFNVLGNNMKTNRRSSQAHRIEANRTEDCLNPYLLLNALKELRSLVILPACPEQALHRSIADRQDTANYRPQPDRSSFRLTKSCLDP